MKEANTITDIDERHLQLGAVKSRPWCNREE